MPNLAFTLHSNEVRTAVANDEVIFRVYKTQKRNDGIKVMRWTLDLHLLNKRFAVCDGDAIDSAYFDTLSEARYFAQLWVEARKNTEGPRAAFADASRAFRRQVGY